MENFIDLTAYGVIVPVYLFPEVNPIEKAILKYLRIPLSFLQISELLKMDVTPFLYGLMEKKILNQDGTFYYKNKAQWFLNGDMIYKKGYVFTETGKDKYYDHLVYVNEIKLNDNNTLANFLGESFTKEEDLPKLQFLHQFNISYDPANTDAKKTLRQLSQFNQNPFDFVYKER